MTENVVFENEKITIEKYKNGFGDDYIILRNRTLDAVTICIDGDDDYILPPNIDEAKDKFSNVGKAILENRFHVKNAKKYNVTCVTNKSDERDNYVGGLIEADSEEEAIENAIVCIEYCINDNIGTVRAIQVKTSDDEIEVYNDKGELVESYFDFKAEEY